MEHSSSQEATTAVPAAISELAEKLTREIDDHNEGQGLAYQKEYNEVYGKLVDQSTLASVSQLQTSPTNAVRSEFGEDDEDMPMSSPSTSTSGAFPSSLPVAPSRSELEQGEDALSPLPVPEATAVETEIKHSEIKKAAPKRAQGEPYPRSSDGFGSSLKQGSSGFKRSHASLGYSRIVKDRSKWQPFEDQDATVKKSSFSLVKDRLGSVWRGETAEERDLRLRLDWYRRALLGEVGVLQASLQVFEQRRFDGAAKLENEIRTLESQGLQPLVKYLQLQFWSYLDRYGIVESLTCMSLKAMQSRHGRSARVIELYQEELASIRENKEQKHDLDSFRNFCLHPEDVVAKEASFVSLSKRLPRMDRVVNNTRDSFLRNALPKISAPSYDRVPTVHTLVQTYDMLREEKAPTNFNDTDFGWEDLCAWYVELHRQKLRTELTFMDIVIDERERNGRLFKQWVEFVLKDKRGARERKHSGLFGGDQTRARALSSGALSAMGGSTKSTDMSRVSTNEQPPKSEQPQQQDQTNGPARATKSPATATKEQETVISPRSVLAFIKYYATVVLAADYGVQTESVGALKALTEVAVYRRVHSKTYHYTSVSLHARDLHWIYKCLLAKFVDPVTFGIEEVYLHGSSKEKNGTRENENEKTRRPAESSTSGSREKSPKEEAVDVGTELDAIDAKYDVATLFGRDIVSPAVPTAGTRSSPSLRCDHYGRPYARVSKLLSLMTTTVDPRHIADILLLAVKWLMKEAVMISGKTDLLGADTVFPILVLSLVYADIPNMHLMLQYLHNYAEISEASETSYYLTCLEAAVEYIIRLEVPQETAELVRAEIEAGRMPPHGGLEDMNDVVTFEALTGGEQDCKSNEKSDLEDLGEWLREYQTMEDTISILTKEGIF